MKYAGAVVASAFAGLFGILVASRGCLHGASSRSAEAREDEARARWPSLPRDEQAASVLIARRKLRAEAEVPDAELQSEALMKRAPGPGWGSAVVGVEATQAWIQGFLDRATARGRDAYVLFGTFHDAAGQVDAFRRLVGPGGLRGLTSVTAEQFRATGAWSDVDERAQRGDDDEIAAYVERGDRDAFATLGRRHRESDYAAWKLAYEPSVLELLVTGRAIFDGGLGARFRGCDMPTDTQRLALTRVSEQTLRRLREIHCLAALDEATRDRPEKRRVAMLWGQAHVQTLRQLLPGSAEVLSLYVFGFRSGEETTEASLAKHLAIRCSCRSTIAGMSPRCSTPTPCWAASSTACRIGSRSSSTIEPAVWSCPSRAMRAGTCSSGIDPLLWRLLVRHRPGAARAWRSRYPRGITRTSSTSPASASSGRRTYRSTERSSYDSTRGRDVSSRSSEEELDSCW